MYPVPQRAETSGRSEEYLGRWLKNSGRRREDVVILTKVAGPSGQMTWIRDGPASLDAKNVTAAIDASLKRLGTDYIDLYQVHWPDRYVPMFGDVDYRPEFAFPAVPLSETLAAIYKAVEQGKIRHVGLSNETPYGLLSSLHAHRQAPGAVARVVSIQNAYSLLCRTFDAGLAEVCHLEGVSLLPYSPLAMGLLTGKYTDHLGAAAVMDRAARGLVDSLGLPNYRKPQGTPQELQLQQTEVSASPQPQPLAYGGPAEARLNRYRGRYAEAEARYGPRPAVLAAVAAYCAIARESGMSPTELALRFALDHPLTASVVFGASTEAQLRACMAAGGKGPLPADVRAAVDRVHAALPNPTP